MTKIKIALYLLSAMIVVSCNKETSDLNNLEKGEGKGNTFAGMTISFNKSALKAADTGQEEDEGTEAEKKITTINLLSSVKDQSWTLGNADEDGKFWLSTDVYKVAPWLTQSGVQTMGLMLNGVVGSFAGLSANTAANYIYGGSDGQAEQELKTLANNEAQSFVMTSKVASENIISGKAKDVVKNGSGKSDNVFPFDAERVVVKGIVKKDASLIQDTKDGKGTLDLTTLKYAPVNSATKTYLFTNNAGDRQMTTQKYGDFKSAIHSSTVASTANDAKTQGLIRLGNIGDAAKTGLYTARKVDENAATSKSDGFYFFENSVSDLSSVKVQGFYRLAYAKVYVKYTPKKVLVLEGDKLVEKDASSAGLVDGTFYKGQTDGLIYGSKEAAKQSVIAKDQKVYVYTKGMCGYRVLWNRISTDAGKTVINADVRRNNVYLLTIKEILGLGMPWDSSDPEDPNLPKDNTNDDSTVIPDNPNIEKQDTYMRVEAKVLKWNVIKRDVTLE
ncbi:Mfa1 family fimbria major subunit [Porphyromonas pogonae]|uniref:Mfa1 family fimbria major subunit n=1 Tax=Porphyromonas pogonae TaxID=867595 RepID=UPI002E78B810|nr:Mfa1 family fimbria major subunit [Porphyromonas pogonae]